MRKFQYMFYLALAGLPLVAHGQDCAPPPGFVNPPRPDIAPLEQLLSHTEEMQVAVPLATVLAASNRPLKDGLKPTKDMPGVSGTFRLTDGPFGSVGSRRLVCLTDGGTAVEEVVHFELGQENRRFRYVVWNYTSPKFRGVSYGVGEFVHTQTAPNQTHVAWTYRFALDQDKSPGRYGRFGKFLFRTFFLEQEFAGMMHGAMQRGKAHVESISKEST